MSYLARGAVVTLFAVCLALGVTAWPVAAISLIQLPFNTKPNSITGWLRFNPLNVIFDSEKLTPRGLAIRRRLIVALGLFLSALLAALVSGLIAKLIGSAN